MLKAKINFGEWDNEICLLPETVSVGVGDACIVAIDDVPEWAVIQEIAECAAGETVSEKCRFIRPAGDEDHVARRKIEALEVEAINRFCSMAEKHFPDIRPLCARYGFERDFVTLFFRCERKVEWRTMEQVMEDCLQVRVALRQLGARDEAAFLDGLGICGRRLCCASWMRRFQAVNIRMARTQNLSLNPAAISGLCGRLKCCLRFEYNQYLDAEKGLPRIGVRVRQGTEEGTVIGRDILRKELVVRMPDQRIVRGGVHEFSPRSECSQCSQCSRTAKESTQP